jgi:Na+-translocating ferredoxin:NAD+ oxidoreductase subunit C
MGSAVFKGGVHPDYHKEITATMAVTAMKAPEKVVIPLQQHIGAPCEPLEGIEVGARG